MGIRVRLFFISAVILGVTLFIVQPTATPFGLHLLLTVVASLGIAQLGTRHTMISANALAEAAQRMAQGDLEARARKDERDEFSPVGRSLDQLAERMSNTLHALKVERDLMGGILQGMHEGVLLLDKAGRIAILNPALRSMLLLGADAVGRYPLEAIRNAKLKELLDRARETGSESGEVELSGIKPRRLFVRATALLGEPGGLLAVFVDVTDIRRLESIRRDFVANVSHELRTPVTAIRSAAETIRGAAAQDPAAAVRFLDIIERNAERLQQLVEDLLELSRIESKEFRLAVEPVELQVFVPYVLSLFRERAEKKRIRLHSLIAANVPPVQADRRALEQVITNLVDNAVKYCPPGSDVAVKAESEAGSVAIAVADTGPGIDEKHLPRIFERFYRVDPGRSREVGGTGLGLSIVKHLVEALGGTIAVESAPGKGSTFSFSLATTKPVGLAKAS